MSRRKKFDSIQSWHDLSFKHQQACNMLFRFSNHKNTSQFLQLRWKIFLDKPENKNNMRNKITMVCSEVCNDVCYKWIQDSFVCFVVTTHTIRRISRHTKGSNVTNEKCPTLPRERGKEKAVHTFGYHNGFFRFGFPRPKGSQKSPQSLPIQSPCQFSFW